MVNAFECIVTDCYKRNEIKLPKKGSAMLIQRNNQGSGMSRKAKESAVNADATPSEIEEHIESIEDENPAGIKNAELLSAEKIFPTELPDYAIWNGDVAAFLQALPQQPTFDLIVSSPPYNIGKSYESKKGLEQYLEWQERIIDLMVPLLKDSGSLCWQVGNFVDNGVIAPLDIEFAPIFKKHRLQLRNRIIWHFGHGLHNKRRFSGRYETIMWYTKTDDYFFNLNQVRVPAKYPGKKHFKGPKAGKLSGNPLGKNPEDVWSIPNVKSNHVEKTDHPCQFPVGLIERLVLSMSKEGDLVFDPFAGVASAGVAATIHGRRFIGCELDLPYAKTGLGRLQDALDGTVKYRPHDKPIYDHMTSPLSKTPASRKEGLKE